MSILKDFLSGQSTYEIGRRRIMTQHAVEHALRKEVDGPPPDDWEFDPNKPFWHGPKDTYKVIGAHHYLNRVVVTTSNVYKTGHLSRVFFIYPDETTAYVFKKSIETIGQPFGVGERLMCPVEHSDKVFELISGAPRYELPLPRGEHGNWSMCGYVDTEGKYIIPYNVGPYKNKQFQDNPKFCSVDDGDSLFELDVKGFVTSVAQDKATVFALTNFGKVTLTVIISPTHSSSLPAHDEHGRGIGVIAYFNGDLYGGGGAEFHVDGETGNGRIYKLSHTGQTWREIRNTGAKAIITMKVINDRLWVSTSMKDKLLVINRHGNIKKVAEIPHEGSYDKRSFGSTMARFSAENVAWFRSSGTRTYGYLIPINV